MAESGHGGPAAGVKTLRPYRMCLACGRGRLHRWHHGRFTHLFDDVAMWNLLWGPKAPFWDRARKRWDRQAKPKGA